VRDPAQSRRRPSRACESPRIEVIEAPSMEIFQARLDGALRNLIQLKMSLLIARGTWTRTSLKVPSNPNFSTIL